MGDATEYHVIRPNGQHGGIKAVTDAMAERLENNGFMLIPADSNELSVTVLDGTVRNKIDSRKAQGRRDMAAVKINGGYRRRR